MQLTTRKTVNQWTEYTLTNDHDMSVSFLDFGGIITKMMVPNREGKLENIVLSYEDYKQYEDNPNYFGALIGRVAGRIEKASFELDGKEYLLIPNEGKHHLHGGTTGFHQVLWETKPFQTENEIGMKLFHSSPDNDGGYPGNLDVTVKYTLTNDNEFIIDYEAISDQKTIISLTNHTYFNLSGNLKDTVEQHVVMMDCEGVLELDHELIPTGKLMEVKGTPFDFSQGRTLAEGIQSEHPQNIIAGNGYDHYFLLNDGTIVVKDESSGRVMKVKTNQPGVVMYTSNTLEEGLQLQGGISKQYSGVCFETQGSPASLHHTVLPEITLQAGEKYQKQTIFSFQNE